MGRYEDNKEAIAAVADAVAKEIPQELLSSIVGKKIVDVLESLSDGYRAESLNQVVEEAVKKKMETLLETEFKEEVTKLAREKANEALVIAKRPWLYHQVW